MFDFDAGKLLIIGIVALVFIPSKDLPRVLRQIGQFTGKMRRMASEFQTQFMDAMREADMAELKREAEKLAKAAEIDPNFPGVRDAPEEKPAVPAIAAEAHPPVAAHGDAVANHVSHADAQAAAHDSVVTETPVVPVAVHEATPVVHDEHVSLQVNETKPSEPQHAGHEAEPVTSRA